MQVGWPALVAIALSIWGWVFPGAITVVEDDSGDTLETGRVIASISGSDLDAGDCVITVYPARWDADYDPQIIILHEVGHCIGVGHIEGPGVMNAAYWAETRFTGYDRAALWQVHPAPYRVAIPMVVTI